MKTMKYSLLSLFLVVISITCTVSCGEDYSSPLKGIVVDNQTFETGTNNKTVGIGTKDISKCTITSSAAWCSASIQGSSVVINVQPNDTYEERRATITLNDPEDATTISFLVIQKQNNAVILDKSIYTMDPEGGKISVEVKSNVSYRVELPDQNWLSLEGGKTRGLQTSIINFVADVNHTKNERIAIVKLIDEETGTSSSLTIKQDISPFIEIDKDYIVAHECEADRYASFTIFSNVEYELKPQVEWITINPSVDQNVTDGNNVKFICACDFMNYPIIERVGSIIVESDKYNIRKEISLKQVSLIHFEIEGDINIKVGETINLRDFLYDSTQSFYIWSVSAYDIAYLDNSGNLTGIRKGRTLLTLSTYAGIGAHVITKNVNVIEDQKPHDNPDYNENDVSNNINVEIVTSGILKGFGKSGSYVQLKITNNSNKTINITKLLAYKEYGELLGKINNSKQLESGDSYEVTIETSEGTMLDSYFWYHKWKLEIYYSTESDNNTNVKTIMF